MEEWHPNSKQEVRKKKRLIKKVKRDIDRHNQPQNPNTLKLTYDRIRQKLGEVALPVDPLFLDYPPGSEPE